MDKVLKFPVSEKIFHNVNLVSWMFLAISGVIIYFKLADNEILKLLMDLHIAVAVVFTINFLGFVFLAMDRFIIMMRNLLIWDKDTFAWFKNLGGYPRRLFGIKFGPEEVAPQGRFNAGQKITYLFFIFMIFALIITGWFLYTFAPVLGKTTMIVMFNLHVWGSIIATIVAICAHMPLALINFGEFKAMFSLKSGDVSLEDSKHHAPKWVEKDLVKIED